jgi:protein-S-isoprenylcysteine O-methyltransferase Ste14
LTKRPASVLATASLVLLCVLFAWANFSSWRTTGRPTGLGATVLECWTAGLFLVRRGPTVVSGRVLAWLAAPVGSFGMLLSRPGGDGGLTHVVAEPLQLVGVGLALASLGALGRSFGVVAANRGVRTGGPYRFVRHPAYFGYLVTNVAYVAENPSIRNTAIFTAALIAQLMRIHEEERLLATDVTYRTYMGRVRRRLIPYVF